MASQRKPVTTITPSEAERAQATIEAFQSQQHEAAKHAALLERDASARNAKRARELTAHYESAIAQAMRDYLDGDDSGADRVVTLVQEATADCTTVEVQAAVPGKVVFRQISGDRAALVSLYRSLTRALDVEATGIDAVVVARGEDYRGRTKPHPVLTRCLNACAVNTADAWRLALDAARDYLAFFVCSSGRQGQLKPTNADGFELLPRYRAWVRAELEAIHDAEPRRAYQVPVAVHSATPSVS